MISSIIVYVFLACIILGILALIPMLFINNKTGSVDENMYKKNFDAEGTLKTYKSNKADPEPNVEKKLNSFKIKDK